jgi:hypothetical protein
MQTHATEVFAPPWCSLVDYRGSQCWRHDRRCWRADGKQMRTENTFYSYSDTFVLGRELVVSPLAPE